MFIVISLVDKWKKAYEATKQKNREGAAMLLSLFISCVLLLLKC